jgi:exodeoxyribonuclease VII large subunit
VVTGVGHEVDVTIADFAADRRAATPSAAAELVSPEAGEWRRKLTSNLRRLTRDTRRRVSDERRMLTALSRRLIHPRRRLFDFSQGLDALVTRLARTAHQAGATRRARWLGVDTRLRQQNPSQVLARHRASCRQLSQRLHHASARNLTAQYTRLAALVRAMEAVSPGRTLDRGYAIVTRAVDGKLVRAANEVAVGDEIDTRLASGQLRSTVKRRD